VTLLQVVFLEQQIDLPWPSHPLAGAFGSLLWKLVATGPGTIGWIRLLRFLTPWLGTIPKRPGRPILEERFENRAVPCEGSDEMVERILKRSHSRGKQPLATVA
jgi:hypothetical protein